MLKLIGVPSSSLLSSRRRSPRTVGGKLISPLITDNPAAVFGKTEAPIEGRVLTIGDFLELKTQVFAGSTGRKELSQNSNKFTRVFFDC